MSAAHQRLSGSVHMDLIMNYYYFIKKLSRTSSTQRVNCKDDYHYFPPFFKQGYLGDPGPPGPVHFQDGHDARGKNILVKCSLPHFVFV